MLCHEGSHYLQWSYVAGAKEGDRQEVLACLASQLQTSVIPQLNTCVCVYLCVCLCVSVCVCVHGCVRVIGRKCFTMNQNLLDFL